MDELESGSPPPRAQRALAWLPAGVWAGVIWGLGSDGFSAPNTGGLLEALFGWLWPSLDAHALALLHALIRKLAHATEYGVLALLCLRALRSGSADPRDRNTGSPVGQLALAIALPALLAIADETRQLAVPSRTGSILDVGLDTLGAIAALAGRALWQRLRAKRAPAVLADRETQRRKSERATR